MSATCYGFEAKYPEPGDDADTTDCIFSTSPASPISPTMPQVS
ncbi:hypothetical protein [Hallella absiana]|nr:hypothetical protein [Hallella absiana]